MTFPRPTKKNPVLDESWYRPPYHAPTVLCTSNSYRACRFCGEADDSVKLKYGVRHYAHPECFAGRYGRAPFGKMSRHILMELPVFVMQDAAGIDLLTLIDK